MKPGAINPRPAAALLLLTLAGWPLAGCKLIDQTTFGATPQPPAPDQLSLAFTNPGQVPLVVIRSDAPQEVYAQALADAVESAEQRKPDVVFDVVTVVPGKGTPAQQNDAVASAQQDALTIVDRMADAGADPERIHLSARVDPAATDREVRMYVH